MFLSDGALLIMIHHIECPFFDCNAHKNNLFVLMMHDMEFTPHFQTFGNKIVQENGFLRGHECFLNRV